MRLTTRDWSILSTIHAYDGTLSINQIHRWFFGARRRAEIRISLLHRNGFIERSGRDQRHLTPTPVVWLTKFGAQMLAGHLGIPANMVAHRPPRWSKLTHDLMLGDVRHIMEQALEPHQTFSLDHWSGQHDVIRLFPSPIEFRGSDNRRKKRLVQPDGFCTIMVNDRRPHKLRFFIELDRGSESNIRFVRDKVYAGIQFVNSKYYKETVGATVPARFLVVVNAPQKHYDNLRGHVAEAGGAGFFLFTRTDRMTTETALTGNIWQLPHLERCFSLQEYDTDAFQNFIATSLRGQPRPKLL